jgi:uncharacterized protein DUF326
MTHAPATYALVDRALQECIEECSTCHHVCLLTSAHCLSQGGAHVRAEHLTLLADCADVCQTTANLMLRGSEQHGFTCAACAAICSACEQSCAAFPDDRAMRECADACRRCADACEKLAETKKPTTT